jgi:NitT/TauT family transport system substrate-binding protein
MNHRCVPVTSKERSRFRVTATVFSTLLLFALVTACGGGGSGGSGTTSPAAAGSSGSSSPQSITVVNGISSFEFIAADMAEKQGIWDKLNLKVNYIHGSGGGGQVTTTLTAKQADVGLHGGGAAAVSIAKGMPAKIVAVTAKSFAGMVCVVQKTSNIHSFQDLKGKTMGISSAGSLTDLVARKIAAKNGWKLGSEFKEATIGDLSQLTAALQQGIVDVICWSTEPALTLVEKGQGRILGNAGDIVGPNIYEAVIATDDAIANKPEAVRRYLQGYFMAVKYMKSHEAETVKLIQQEENVSESVAQQTFKTSIDNESVEGTATDEMLTGLASTASDVSGTKVDASQVWDPTFVPIKTG